MQRTIRLALAVLATAATIGALPRAAGAQGGAVVNFETIPTRAVSLSPDGTRLFVTNTPDSRLDIFAVSATGLTPVASVPVGLEPVAVNARTNTEVWVVNLLSDSVSIVDVGANPPRVVRTIPVGDEPRDVVFAGPNHSRAFVTAARRGQNHPNFVDILEQNQVEGLGRADVWVFDANNLGEGLFANRLGIITLFGDKPGPMGVSPDGSRVFVALATSGNETTAINDSALCGENVGAGGQLPAAGMGQFSNQNNGPCRTENGGVSPGGVPAPNTNNSGRVRNPRTGLIAKFDRNGRWLDVLGRDWANAVPFTLPDLDVFEIDANANPPAQVGSFAHVGTLNFGVATHPTNGKTYVATINAINTNRFISVPAANAFPNPNRIGNAARTADPATGKSLRGHLYESRISILSPGGAVVSRHLNKHINYELEAQPAGVKERSVADPHGVAFSPDGQTLFVAALGSNAIVPFPTAQLDNDSFTPDAATHIQLSGMGGPTDMVFDQSGSRMFVYRRFDNAVSIVDVTQRREVASVAMYSPEPPSVVRGRPFFYDALKGSSNGEANCNVCHPAADKDDLPWDLGTPFFEAAANPNPFVNGFVDFLGLFGVNPTREFNPLKGPMTPLTLRGIKDSGPMFWRGDITNAMDPQNERTNFSQGFGIVFQALNGLDSALPQENLNQLTDWALSIVPPPNPHRTLDQVLNASQMRGMGIFMNGSEIGNTDVIFNCVTCHALNPAMGFFGTAGQDTIEGETQFFKVTQLRTVYDKVGMFGHTFGDNGDARTNRGPRVNVGPQIRASGTLHDGSAAAIEEFLTADVFQLTPAGLLDVVNFTFAFPSNLAPVVGQQVTLRAGSGADVEGRIRLLKMRANASFVLPGNRTVTECNLVARAVMNGQSRGFLFRPATSDFMDSTGAVVSDATLRMAVPVTFTCVYPGGGRRLAIDRDQDNVLDAADNMLNPAPEAAPQQPPAAPPAAGGNLGLVGGILSIIGGFTTPGADPVAGLINGISSIIGAFTGGAGS